MHLTPNENAVVYFGTKLYGDDAQNYQTRYKTMMTGSKDVLQVGGIDVLVLDATDCCVLVEGSKEAIQALAMHVRDEAIGTIAIDAPYFMKNGDAQNG